MSRPRITEYLGDGIELEEAHEIYRRNPGLWSYIQAQDKHIDYIEKELQAERIKALSQAEQNDSYHDVTVKNMTRVIDEQKETIDLFRNQLKKADEGKLSINCDDPDMIILTNPSGDTYWFNPRSEFGEELNDFFYYLHKTQ